MRLMQNNIQMQLKHSEGHRSTQRLILLMVRQILDNAVDDGLVLRNVSRNIKLDPERKEEKRRQLIQFELDCIAAADLDPKERCFDVVKKSSADQLQGSSSGGPAAFFFYHHVRQRHESDATLEDLKKPAAGRHKNERLYKSERSHAEKCPDMKQKNVETFALIIHQNKQQSERSHANKY